MTSLPVIRPSSAESTSSISPRWATLPRDVEREAVMASLEVLDIGVIPLMPMIGGPKQVPIIAGAHHARGRDKRAAGRANLETRSAGRARSSRFRHQSSPPRRAHRSQRLDPHRAPWAGDRGRLRCHGCTRGLGHRCRRTWVCVITIKGLGRHAPERRVAAIDGAPSRHHRAHPEKRTATFVRIAEVL